jgi:hypothetical protein
MGACVSVAPACHQVLANVEGCPAFQAETAVTQLPTICRALRHITDATRLGQLPGRVWD